MVKAQRSETPLCWQHGIHDWDIMNQVYLNLPHAKYADGEVGLPAAARARQTYHLLKMPQAAVARPVGYEFKAACDKLMQSGDTRLKFVWSSA